MVQVRSIPVGLTKEHVLRTLSDLDAGIDHSFGKSTGYEVVHDGKRYAPKAVVGLACRYSIGRFLQPEDFSGGEAPGQANFVLRKLGFIVEKKDENEPETQKGKDWTGNEVQLVVADYFEMLEAELLGKSFKKSDHRKVLAPIPEQYQLFRVFDFGRQPRLYILHGSLRELCQLTPVAC